jgi:hypothetical protein
MVYSFQYAGQNFPGFQASDFSYVDYGVPSIYGGSYQGGNCNYATICNISWWTDTMGLKPSQIILGITVGTWGEVSNYKYGSSTVGNAGFAGYIEWIYNTSEQYNNTMCPSPTPNKC